MAQKFTAAQRRYFENALLVAALRLTFNHLEENYETKYLSEIADTTSGGTPLRTISAYYGGDIPWIKSGELNDNVIMNAEEFITDEGLSNSSAKVFSKGTLVVALYGATVGKTGILGLDAASNQAVCAVFPKTKQVSNEFLFWFLRYKRPDFLRMSFGGAQPNISQKILREVKTPIPPTELQHKLVGFFDVIEKRQNGDLSKNYPKLPEEFSDVLPKISLVDSVVSRFNSVQQLRQDAEIEIKRMLNSAFEKVSLDAPRLPMAKVAPLVRRPVKVDFDKDYFELGVRSFGNGTFHKPALNGADVGTKKLFFIEPGDLVFSNVFAWEGGIAVAKPIDKGRVGSHRFITCVPKSGLATAKYLCFYFLTQEGLEKIGIASPGGAGRNRTLGLNALANIEVPVPDYDKQLWFDDLLDKVNALRGLQSQSQEELDALLPSVLDRAFKGEL